MFGTLPGGMSVFKCNLPLGIDHHGLYTLWMDGTNVPARLDLLLHCSQLGEDLFNVIADRQAFGHHVHFQYTRPGHG